MTHKHKRLILVFVQVTLLFTVLFLLVTIFPSDGTQYQDDIFDLRLAPAWANYILKDRKWALQTTIDQLTTKIEIPKYLLKPNSLKPLKAPFDPRLTLAFYYDYIRTNANLIEPLVIPFHWSDWVDTTVLDPFIYDPSKRNITCAHLDLRPYQSEHYNAFDLDTIHSGALDPKLYCNDVPFEKNGLRFEIHQFPGRFTEETAAIVGKAYLISSAPNPTSLVILTGSGLYHVLLDAERETLMNGTMIRDFLERNPDAKYVDTLEQLRLLQKAVSPSTVSSVGDEEITLSHEDFILDPMEDLFEVESEFPETLSRHEKMYLDAHRTSTEMDNSPEKYFMEAQIFDNLLGDHFDWRFFRGVEYFNDESANTMSRLIRTWLQFVRSQGLNSWIAHGTLFSWKFNGINFPWDLDGDVQMPIKDLQKLALRFNQSLVVENGEEGFGRFFLDCGTSITKRTNTNGNNNIDARFIDVDTGFYIDITGLAVSGETPPDRYFRSKNFEAMGVRSLESESSLNELLHEFVNNAMQLYNCRNFHFVQNSELSPLRKTFFEGVVAYVPNKYHGILKEEYGDEGLQNHLFGGVFFVPKLRIWVSTMPLRQFLRYRQFWNDYFGVDRIQTRKGVPEMVVEGDLSYEEQQMLINLSDEDVQDLLLHDDILFQYVQSCELTEMHDAEIANFEHDRLVESHLHNRKPFYPNKFEPFLFRMKKKGLTYDQTVKTYMKQTRQLVSPSWMSFQYF